MKLNSWPLNRRGFARRRSYQNRTFKPILEVLEDREVLSPFWSSYAMNAQHTADSTVGAQALQAIRWETPVDLNPQYSGNDLLIHYGSAVITNANTVIIPVKTGASGGFEVEGVNGANGAEMWTQTTDYILPPHDWTPSYSPVLTSANRLYFAGAGGTVYYIDNVDSSTPSAPVQLAFYGLANYSANPSAFNSKVFINTPLTADSQGDIFFGFRVTGSNPSNLSSGIARISANGSGTWVSAQSISADSNITVVPHQAAPALSNDESTLYVATASTGNWGYGYLIALNATTLAVKTSGGVAERVRLKDPRNSNANDASMLDASSASPMVGPDGDVYYGVMGNPYNGSRGWMLHFSGDLLTEKTPGAFGWDDTASIVPASMVPSYTGTSSYLIFSKYNNYAGVSDGGDGINKVAILDPNDTEVEPHASSNGLLVMKEILTIAGPTPDPDFDISGYPNAVREWCINTAVVDPITKSVLVNSEDGKLYRWDMTTNSFTQTMTLTPGIGEAYTPTVMGPDGTVYAINNATLFAVDAVTHLTISAPASATAGSPFSITVTAQDENNKTAASYLGTIHFTTTDSGAGVSLPADYTFTAGDGGSHTFSVTLVTAGNQTVTATDTATSAFTTTTGAIAVNPAAAAHFSVSAPGSSTAGMPFDITVTAFDAFQNQATNYTGTVHFTSSDAGPGRSLPADYTFTGGDAGAHTFSSGVTLVTAGNQTVTATDTVTSATTGTVTVSISPAAVSQFKVTAPSSSTAGVAFTIAVTAEDAFQNTTPSYTGTVHFTASDPGPGRIVPADYTFTGGDTGVHTFSNGVTLITAGNQTLTATDNASSGLAGMATVAVNAAAASHLALSAPSTATAGSAFSVTISLRDPFQNIATGYTGTVHFTSSDTGSGVSLPADYTFTGGDAGVHTFSNGVTLATAGGRTITATDTANSSLTDTASVTVSPGATAKFLVNGFSSPTIAGASHNFTVTATDQFGNLTAGYKGTVHFTSSDAKAALPANYTFTAGDSGVHTFSATLRTAGSQSITATDTITSSIFGSQTGITVSPGMANHLILSRFPSVTTAGVAQSFRITAQDLYGNTVTSFTDTVSFSSTDAQAVLPANYSFASADMGVHNFLATLKTVGTQSLTAKDVTTPTVTSATMSGITVNPAATSQFQISGFPASVTAGTAYAFTVTAVDPYGNTTPGYRGTVHFTSSDNAANLPSNYSYTSGDAGVHNFMATLNTGGTQSITVTDTVNPSISGTQSGISVTSVQPTAGLSGPSGGVPGQPLTFTLSASESGLPTNTTYSFSIQWGDGSPVQTLSGPSGTQVNHVFTASGTFSVSLTATDPSGNASVPATMSVALSTVLMETDPFNSSLTALYVGGTTGSDTIAITPVVNNGVNNGVKVAMNFVSYGSFTPTGHVIVYGQSGNDIIKTAPLTINGVLTYVNVPLLIFAGNGNDTLNVSGSMANNVLVGGAGSDTLFGGLGRDIEIGGSGPSTLHAGNGGDILIGGTTDWDTNAAALAAVLAEWGRTDADYATRIAHLMNGGGLNVTMNGNVLLNSSTVHSDGMTNYLFGGAGLDWFFVGMTDIVITKPKGQTYTQVS